MNSTIHISSARKMLEAGQPVALTYVKKNGQVIDLKNVVSLRYDFYTGMRTIKLLHNGRKMSIHDVCIIGINDFEVFL